MKEFDKYFQEKPKKHKTLKRFILIILLLAIVLLIAFRITQSASKKAEAARKQALLAQKTAIPVEVQKITQEVFRETIESNGDIEGIETINLFSDYAGKIIKVYVYEGQRVSKGQTVALMNRDVVVQRFEDYPIKALINGIVGKINLKDGETVTTSSPVMSIVNVNTVKCITKIVEKDLNKVKKNKEVLIRVDAYPNVVFKGYVSEISPVLDPLSRASEVTVLVSNSKYPNTPLRPGMYASAQILVGELPNSLLVPFSSVLEDEFRNASIFVYRDNRAKKIALKTGGIKHYGDDTSKDKIVVYGDIKAGDYVIYVGHQFLNDGDKIRFQIDEKKFGPEGEEK